MKISHENIKISTWLQEFPDFPLKLNFFSKKNQKSLTFMVDYQNLYNIIPLGNFLEIAFAIEKFSKNYKMFSPDLHVL